MMFANPLHSAALAAYPVGSIYMSANATDPGTLFGGTWSRIQGRFLLAADGDHAAGSTGGEEQVVLSSDTLPDLRGRLSKGYSVDWGQSTQTVRFLAGQNAVQADGGSPDAPLNQVGAWQSDTSVIISGGNQPHNNMPPYLSVYVWQRTA